MGDESHEKGRKKMSNEHDRGRKMRDGTVLLEGPSLKTLRRQIRSRPSCQIHQSEVAGRDLGTGR